MTKILIDEALVRQALEALELVAWTNNPPVNKAITAIREALAEAALDALLDKMAENARELGLAYMEGSAEQYEKELLALEPDPDELTIAYMSGVYEGKKRKPWVGLTDEEIEQLDISAPTMKIAIEDVAIIEAKLKEKNT